MALNKANNNTKNDVIIPIISLYYTNNECFFAADCQPPDNWFIASAKVIPFHPDSIENNEVTFTIHLSKVSI